MATQAIVTLTLASLDLRRTPNDRLLARLGKFQPVGAYDTPVNVAELAPTARDDLRAAARVGRIVTRAARLLPWHPSCLRQSLATRWLLARRGIDSMMLLGVSDPSNMNAHAWITVHGHTVVGRQARTFTPVAAIRRDPRRA